MNLPAPLNGHSSELCLDRCLCFSPSTPVFVVLKLFALCESLESLSVLEAVEMV